MKLHKYENYYKAKFIFLTVETDRYLGLDTQLREGKRITNSVDVHFQLQHTHEQKLKLTVLQQKSNCNFVHLLLKCQVSVT